MIPRSSIYLGLRKNEAVHVRWKDLVLDRLHPTTGQPSPICLIQQREGFTTKTYENRKVPISAEAVRLLQQYRPDDAAPDDYVLDAERHHQKRGGTKRVYRYDPVKVWRRALKVTMAKGDPHIELKKIRHRFACNCLMKGHRVDAGGPPAWSQGPRMVRQHYAFPLDYEEDTELEFLSEGSDGFPCLRLSETGVLLAIILYLEHPFEGTDKGTIPSDRPRHRTP